MYFNNANLDKNVMETLSFSKLNYKVTKRILKKAPDHAAKAERGALLTINFCGIVAPNTIVEEVRRYQCHLGDFEVVEGLELALYTMKVGEVAKVSMDSWFGYGIFGLQDNTDAYIVPPHTRIGYIIELLSIKTEILQNITDNRMLRQCVARKKARGDFWLKRLEFTKATYLYKRALDYLFQMNDDVVAISRAEGLPLSNYGLKIFIRNRKRADFDKAMTEAKLIGNHQRKSRNFQDLFHLAKLLILLGRKPEAFDRMGEMRDAFNQMVKLIQLYTWNNCDAASETKNIQKLDFSLGKLVTLVCWAFALIASVIAVIFLNDILEQKIPMTSRTCLIWPSF